MIIDFYSRHPDCRKELISIDNNMTFYACNEMFVHTYVNKIPGPQHWFITCCQELYFPT